jgi:hypothetical protein
VLQRLIEIQEPTQKSDVTPWTVRGVYQPNLEVVLIRPDLKRESQSILWLAALTPLAETNNTTEPFLLMASRELCVVDGVCIAIFVDEPRQANGRVATTFADGLGWLLEVNFNHGVLVA